MSPRWSVCTTSSAACAIPASASSMSAIFSKNCWRFPTISSFCATAGAFRRIFAPASDQSQSRRRRHAGRNAGLREPSAAQRSQRCDQRRPRDSPRSRSARCASAVCKRPDRPRDRDLEIQPGADRRRRRARRRRRRGIVRGSVRPREAEVGTGHAAERRCRAGKHRRRGARPALPTPRPTASNTASCSGKASPKMSSACARSRLGATASCSSAERFGELAAERCRQLGVVAASMQQPVGALSGGNQQKVVFAKWIEAAPSLLVLDDPTRGIDIGAKREMHRIMRRLAQSGQGRSVLLERSGRDRRRCPTASSSSSTAC